MRAAVAPASDHEHHDVPPQIRHPLPQEVLGRAGRRRTVRPLRTAPPATSASSVRERRVRPINPADGLHLSRAHAGRGLRRRAQAQSRRDEGRAGVVGDGVAVEGDAGTIPAPPGPPCRSGRRRRCAGRPGPCGCQFRPETSRNPSAASAEPNAAAIGHDGGGVGAELGAGRLGEGHRLGRDDCARAGRPGGPGRRRCRPSWPDRGPHRIAPPRGPRSVLWVVKVTTSATPTGLGCTPPAMRPAGVRRIEHERGHRRNRRSRGNGSGSIGPGVGGRAGHNQGGLLPLGQIGHLVEVDDLAGVVRVGPGPGSRRRRRKRPDLGRDGGR